MSSDVLARLRARTRASSLSSNTHVGLATMNSQPIVSMSQQGAQSRQVNADNQSDVVHSTPAGSPIGNDERDRDLENFILDNCGLGNGTPVHLSEGTQLAKKIARGPQQLPSIDGSSSKDDLNKYLDILQRKIEYYEQHFTSTIGWESQIEVKFNELTSELEHCQNFAIKLKDMSLKTRISKLANQTDQNLEQWNALRQASENPTPDTSNFHGFGSEDVPVTNVTTTAEEIPPISQPFPPNASIFTMNQSVDIEEDLRAQLKEKGYEAQLNRLMPRVAAPEKITQNLESQFTELSTSASAMEDKFKNLDDQMTATTAACKQYDSFAANILETESRTRKQISSLFAEIRSLSKAVNGMSSRLNSTIKDSTFLASIHQNQMMSTCSGIAATSYLQTQPTYVMNGAPRISSHTLPQQSMANFIPTSAYTSIQGVTPLSFANFMPSNPLRPIPVVPQPAHQVPDPITTAFCQPGTANQSPAGGTSECSGADESSASSSHLTLQGRVLRGQMKNLEGLLFPKLDKELPNSTLNDIYRNKLPAVDTERRELQAALRDILKNYQDNFDYALCEQVQDVLEDAAKWSTEVRELFQKQGCHMKTMTKQLYEGLPRFSKTSDINIFEFLKKFEKYTRDFEIPSERAELLYTKHLSSEIQEELAKEC